MALLVHEAQVGRAGHVYQGRGMCVTRVRKRGAWRCWWTRRRWGVRGMCLTGGTGALRVSGTRMRVLMVQWALVSRFAARVKLHADARALQVRFGKCALR